MRGALDRDTLCRTRGVKDDVAVVQVSGIRRRRRQDPGEQHEADSAHQCLDIFRLYGNPCSKVYSGSGGRSSTSSPMLSRAWAYCHNAGVENSTMPRPRSGSTDSTTLASQRV